MADYRAVKTKSGEDRWQVCVFAGRDGNGKQRWISETVRSASIKETIKRVRDIEGDLEWGDGRIAAGCGITPGTRMNIPATRNIVDQTDILYQFDREHSEGVSGMGVWGRAAFEALAPRQR